MSGAPSGVLPHSGPTQNSGPPPLQHSPKSEDTGPGTRFLTPTVDVSHDFRRSFF